jgi:hypothetical protein
LRGGRSEIVRIEDSTPVIQINEAIPALGDEEILMWGSELCGSHSDESVDISHGLSTLGQIVKSAMERPARREACRCVLAGAGRIWCDDRTGTAMVDEMNRRLGCLWMSDWREGGLVAALKGNLGELHAVFRLLWEWQKRVRCGVPSEVPFRGARVCGVEEWRELDVRQGCVVCNRGFLVLRSASEEGWAGMSVGEGEIGVVLELEGGRVRRLVRRGVRGYTCRASEGVLPPFALLRVGSVSTESGRAVVKLMAVACTGHGLGGVGRSW